MIKLKDVVFLLGIAVFLWLFYEATSMYPICSDDMTYTFMFGSSERVQTVSDVFVSQAHHYSTWGGRFVSHCGVQIALLFKKEWFNLINVLAYAMTAWAVVAVSGKGKNMGYYLIAIMSLWIMMPHSGSTMFWLTGTFNYLWPSCLSALFLFCLFSQSKWAKCLALFIGVIAGNGHECISIGLTVALLLYIITSSKKDRLFYAGVLCFLVGTLSNVVAPGNFQRLLVGSSASKEDIDLFQHIVGYGKTFAKIVWEGIFKNEDFAFRCCVALCCISLVIGVRGIKKGEKQYVFPLCVLIGALSTLALNIVTKCIYPRSLYGFCFLSYFSFLIILGRTNIQRKHLILNSCFMLGLVTINAIEIPKAYRYISTLRSMYERIEEYACAQRTIVPEVSGWQEAQKSKYVEAYGVFPSMLQNSGIKRYYNGLEMSILPQSVYDSICQCAEALSQSEVHQRVYADNSVWYLKLKQLPLSASVRQYQQPAIPAFLATFVNQFARPSLRDKNLPVIRIGDSYYVYGESQDAEIPLKIVYSKQEVCSIPPKKEDL